MTKEETTKILRMLRINYPQSFLHITKEDSEMLIEQYYAIFQDDEAESVFNAIQYIIATDTREFAPNIATIRNTMSMLMGGDEMSEEEAWYLVKEALRNSIYGSREEYADLPKPIQRALGGHETLKDWATADLDELDTVIASNFMRTYRSIAKQEQQRKALPQRMKELLAIGNDDIKKIK